MGKDRFGFGNNWKKYLENLTDERIKEAEASLREWLSVSDLQGKTFLDIGSGSGLFSLSARNLGASVFSFDYDADSVECARYLKEKYYPDDSAWHIEQGDVLDEEYLAGLEPADIVYSWGVLHHTGNMYQAFANVDPLVKGGGGYSLPCHLS